MRPVLSKVVLGLATALFTFIGPSAVRGQEDQPEVPGTIQYLAIGARNDANVATVVSCTNVGPYADTVGVTFLDAAGTSVCSLDVVDPAVNRTVTFVTQPVDLFPSASSCGDPGPTIAIGAVQMGGYTGVRCSALLIAPNSTSPAFAVSLQIYKVN